MPMVFWVLESSFIKKGGVNSTSPFFAKIKKIGIITLSQ